MGSCKSPRLVAYRPLLNMNTLERSWWHEKKSEQYEVYLPWRPSAERANCSVVLCAHWEVIFCFVPLCTYVPSLWMWMMYMWMSGCMFYVYSVWMWLMWTCGCVSCVLMCKRVGMNVWVCVVCESVDVSFMCVNVWMCWWECEYVGVWCVCSMLMCGNVCFPLKAAPTDPLKMSDSEQELYIPFLLSVLCVPPPPPHTPTPLPPPPVSTPLCFLWFWACFRVPYFSSQHVQETFLLEGCHFHLPESTFN